MNVPPPLNALDLIGRLKRQASEHKGSAGKVLLIGGSPGMAGALLLAANACLHLGAGWTILEMLDPASAHVIPEQAELMVRLASKNPAQLIQNTKPDLIAIGPGLGFSESAKDFLRACLLYPKIPLVIDADALNLIAQDRELLELLQERNQAFPHCSVLTPHPGEAARLLHRSTEAIQANRIDALNELVKLTSSIVVLKGHHTLVAASNHLPLVCEQGNPGMGTGGMGDVLTGTIAAIAAQGIAHHLDLWEATVIAVQLHASAADSLVAQNIGPIGLTPSEVILEMRVLLNKLV
jgi:ADP-dependent NAD(P)H-hydrate dehydratase / NAD(P)H-hydrate epimerase